MEYADGIIVCSTTYNMRETALLKNFFDHLCFMLHRPHFFKSKALVITTTGGVGGGAAAKSIVSFLKESVLTDVILLLKHLLVGMHILRMIKRMWN